MTNLNWSDQFKLEIQFNGLEFQFNGLEIQFNGLERPDQRGEGLDEASNTVGLSLWYAKT